MMNTSRTGDAEPPPGAEACQAEAQRILKQAMWQRGLTYRALANMLTARGLPHTKENLANKISRGRFSATFLILCLELAGARVKVERLQGGRE